MSRESLLILIGALIALSPFIGLPYSWLMVIIPVLGALTIIISITLRTRRHLFVKDEEPVYAEAPE